MIAIDASTQVGTATHGANKIPIVSGTIILRKGDSAIWSDRCMVRLC